MGINDAKALPNTPQYNTYVGARYVPLFDGDWSSTKSYEPLTVVYYQEFSYTSKTFVPAGVAPTNTNYWALSGSFNGQVASLQTQLNDVKNTVQSNYAKMIQYNSYDIMWGKRVVLYGDSISTIRGWASTLGQWLPTTGGSLDNRSVSGWTTKDVWQTMSSLTSLSGFDMVIIQAGINDAQANIAWGNTWSSSETDTTAFYVKSIMQKVATLNPKAIVVWIGPSALSLHNIWNTIPRRYVIEAIVNNYGGIYIDTAAFPGFTSLNKGNASDGIHPNEDYGRNTMFKLILGGINAGGIPTADLRQNYISHMDITPAEGVSITNYIMSISKKSFEMRVNLSGKPVSRDILFTLPAALIPSSYLIIGMADYGRGTAIYSPIDGNVAAPSIPDNGFSFVTFNAPVLWNPGRL